MLLLYSHSLAFLCHLLNWPPLRPRTQGSMGRVQGVGKQTPVAYFYLGAEAVSPGALTEWSHVLITEYLGLPM